MLSSPQKSFCQPTDYEHMAPQQCGWFVFAIRHRGMTRLERNGFTSLCYRDIHEGETRIAD